MPKEEQSPTSSKAETSAVLIPSPQSSLSELLTSLESSLSEDELVTSHQHNPERQAPGAYCRSATTANQKLHQMSVTLAFNPEAEDKRPLAEVKITKLKDCLMLTPGRMDDYTFQQWAIACKRYQKHARKADDEVVSFVADGMLEPCFVAWYHANQSRIDRMTLQEYLNELQSQKLVQQLGLKQFPLPAEEDNLTSLSQSPLTCKEFVRLEVVSGKGAWRSQVFRAKVNTGLPVPLLLGMPFLSTEYVVLDLRVRTTIDKRTGYNLANPSTISSTAPHSDLNRVASTPTPPPANDESAERIMAMVRERIETLSMEEQLTQRDAVAKAMYADRFPDVLPPTTDNVPDHIYHRIRLKDPNLVVHSWGYAMPKKYHEP
ncbi:hypothetical protein C0992_013111 [Termitomyces sp. T32_za158]|nr:hypothetical protein C0992_013111 [Termitomyces sp. T32_za158]